MKRDKRLSVSNFSIKGVLFFLAALIVVGGVYALIVVAAYRSNRLGNPVNIILILLFLVIISLIAAVLSAVMKHRNYDAPVHELRMAANKITHGDFSVRLAPRRKDGKKDEIDILYEDFNIMAEELASTETLKTDFISSVSHEIKTPIAVMQNYASFLQSETLSDSERAEYAKTIVQASGRLSNLVNDILNMNRLEHVAIAPPGKSFSLDDQIRGCVVAFEDVWSEKDIQWNAELEEVSICYDENLLALVWNNLISNAVKFTEPDGEITLTLSARDGYAVASVKDSGCGMDEKTMRHIFDRFYQGDTSHSQEGNGLGLAMVKKIVGLIGGELSVESQPGTGSTFTVKLPM